jgi:uncharacterized protein YxjI
MKYYIKQRVFTIGDKYDIYDAYQTPLFHVQGEIFTIGSKLHIYDSVGKELYYIKRRIFTFLPKYEIYQDDRLIANASKQFTFFVSRINIESDLGDFEIHGDFMAHEYSIYKDSQLVTTIHKKWFSWGDSYEIDILDEPNASFYLALVITIDNCMHNESSSGGHTSHSSHR